MVESNDMETALDTKIRANFDVSELVIKDVSGGCGQSFQVILICESFKEPNLFLFRDRPKVDQIEKVVGKGSDTVESAKKQAEYAVGDINFT